MCAEVTKIFIRVFSLHRALFFYSLLKEAQPLESKRTVEMGEEHRHRHGDDDDLFEVEEAGERKMLSRYGIWLLVELCKPKEDCPIVCCVNTFFEWQRANMYVIATSKMVYQVIIFLVSAEKQKHMLWVLIRSASMRHF